MRSTNHEIMKVDLQKKFIYIRGLSHKSWQLHFSSRTGENTENLRYSLEKVWLYLRMIPIDGVCKQQCGSNHGPKFSL